jgi:hypothetical protein
VSALVPVYASRPFPGPNVRSFVGADGDDKFVLVRVERDYGGGNFTVFARKIPDEVRALGVREGMIGARVCVLVVLSVARRLLNRAALKTPSCV